MQLFTLQHCKFLTTYAILNNLVFRSISFLNICLEDKDSHYKTVSEVHPYEVLGSLKTADCSPTERNSSGEVLFH